MTDSGDVCWDSPSTDEPDTGDEPISTDEEETDEENEPLDTGTGDLDEPLDTGAQGEDKDRELSASDGDSGGCQVTTPSSESPSIFALLAALFKTID